MTELAVCFVKDKLITYSPTYKVEVMEGFLLVLYSSVFPSSGSSFTMWMLGGKYLLLHHEAARW